MIKLSNLKIASKLYALIFISIVAIVGIAAFGQYEMGKVFEVANYASINTVPSFKTIYETRNAFREIQILSRDHILSQDDAERATLDSAINNERDRIQKLLDYYEKELVSDDEDKRLLYAVRAALSNYLRAVDARLALSRLNKDGDAVSSIKQARSEVAAVEDAITKHVDYNEKLARETSAHALAEKSAALWNTIAFTILTFAVLSFVGWTIANRELARPIGRVVDNLKALADGSLDVTIVGTERGDEVGNIARAAQVFKEFVQKLDAQGWVKTQEAKFSSALQQSVTIQDFAQKTMSMLCPVIGAQHGLFYVLVDEKLEMRGRYGFRERKHLNQAFEIGEGLVGQCAMDRQAITITKPPEDYIQINSGLGESTPGVIAVLPVLQADSVRGVIELAAFKPFSGREIALLDELMPVLATKLELLERGLKTEMLLKETQEQAARMEAQAAQLEEQSVEMEAQQAALTSTEQWYRSIIAKAPDGAVVVDANGMIILSNAKAEEMFGYESGKMEGLPVDSLVPNSIRDQHYKHRRSFLETGGSRRMGGEGMELTGVRADGSQFAVEVGLSRLPDVGGRGVCAYASVRDITERKKVERAMKEAKELAESATKAKGEFLASMSHEIRTPMNGITGMADLLAQSNLDDDQKHMVKTIRDSGNALITVINDILDFSKIEAGKLQLEEISMSISDALEGVASTLTPNASKKGIRIDTYVDPAIPAAVQGDAVRVRQILFNLAGNAVKFSEKKDVALRATLARSDSDGQVWVRFDVIDHGIGISEENQAKLFQAFSQAESSTTRRFGGTGLGLAICKRLVEMMGGTVGLKSKVGEGSVFTAELPFRPSTTERLHEKARDLSGLNVVLVGSTGMREEAITAYLKHWGAVPETATDDRAAAELIRLAVKDGRAISSIILDLGLDSVRQDEAVRRLRSEITSRKTPLILLQDYQSRGARIREEDVVTVDANPLIRYRIISAVAVAAGRASPEVKADIDLSATKSVKAPSVDEAEALGQLILLAEDNATNQDVIRRQLNMLGFACEIAGDGAQALKAWRTGRYALLLTDCHMPEMDGYDLTGAIRTEEKTSGKRSPIIAVTANALQGEAERCIAAGMDDYVSKPIAMPILRAALKKWMPAPRDSAAKANFASETDSRADTPVVSVRPDQSTAQTGSPIDPRAIREMFGDDDATFKEILESFVEPSQAIIREIVAACDTRTSSGVHEAAHKLKSAARSVGAGALADTCVSLEAAGKAEDWGAIDKLAPRAREQMEAVADYIKRL